MRVLGISGSPRGKQSSTRRLVEKVLEGAQAEGAQVEIFDVGGMRVSYCVACGNCHVKGKCVLKDEFEPLRDKILASDCLVLGSPLYFNGVTAQLKTIIDRLSSAIHCQLLLGKYACSVATSGGPEYDITTNYMNDLLVRFGCAVVGYAGAAVTVPGAMETAEQDALALGRELVRSAQEKRSYPEQDAVHAAVHERFQRLVTFNKENWPYEYEYWRSQNWL